MVVRNQKCSVDLTEVKPGERASLHSHAIRHELFHFLDDGGILEIDGNLFYPKAHEEFLIKPGQKHRFWAEKSNFRMLVVSLGEWKAEDQIRHEDDYGRGLEYYDFGKLFQQNEPAEASDDAWRAIAKLVLEGWGVARSGCNPSWSHSRMDQLLQKGLEEFTNMGLYSSHDASSAGRV